MAPKTSIELLGRYSQTSGMQMKGVTIDQDRNHTTPTYKLESSSTSIIVGLRQKFWSRLDPVGRRRPCIGRGGAFAQLPSDGMLMER